MRQPPDRPGRREAARHDAVDQAARAGGQGEELTGADTSTSAGPRRGAVFRPTAHWGMVRAWVATEIWPWTRAPRSKPFWTRPMRRVRAMTPRAPPRCLPMTRGSGPTAPRTRSGGGGGGAAAARVVAHA